MLLFALIAICLAQPSTSAALIENSTNETNDATCQAEIPTSNPRIPPSCRIVLAPSPLHGYGLFPLVDLRRGQAVLPGDVVVHLTTPQHHNPTSLLAATHYWWSSEDTGGIFSEGPIAMAPGVGMVANGATKTTQSDASMVQRNVLPAVPAVDEAGLTRTQSPGAGAITSFHNWTWFVQPPVLEAGTELLVDYGSQWVGEREWMWESRSSTATNARVPIEILQQTGWCVDQLRPLARSSLRDAGRGAVARLELMEGSVVAPVPVLAIRKEDLQRELLVNYCWGHPDSSLLLYSYGPLVKYVFAGLCFSESSQTCMIPNPTSPFSLKSH